MTSLARALRVFFYIWIVLQLVAIASDLAELRLLDRGIPTLDEANANDDRQTAIGVTQLVFTIITGSVFIVWFRRAYRNLPALGAHRLRTRLGWAVGSWFVPLLNLIRPKQMTDDIWRASYLEAPKTFEWKWHEIRVDPLLHAWWGAWIAGGFIAQIGITLPINSLPDAQRTSWLHLLSDVSLLLAAAFAIPVVNRMTQREHERAARLASEYQAQESPPSPPPPTMQTTTPGPTE